MDDELTSLHERYELYIDGQWTPPANGEYIETRTPATGEVLASTAAASETDVDTAIRAARAAFPEWRSTPATERGRIVTRIGRLVSKHRESLAAIETVNQGKPTNQAESDFEGAERYFEYYAGAADKLEGRSIPVGPDQLDFTIREPYGVSAQIVPWNFPGNLFARGVAPALVAGNTVVVKPAPQTPLTALHLAELCTEAGVPDGVVNVVTGFGDPAGAALSEHPDVDTITFTGSVPTGRAIMHAAAENITKATLELGGKNPALVFPDADLNEAVSWISKAIFTNAGQVCSAADRALVHTDVLDSFVEQIVARAESYDLGPGEEDPDMGPLASEEHVERVVEYIETGHAEGATIVTGGERCDREGYFVEPTVFTDVDPTMQIATEEIFGPVLTVISFESTDDAIEIANGTEYGLTAGVFTTNIRRAFRCVKALDAGNVYVNKWFGDTNQTPFGGYKSSGIGREKGLEAFDSYLQSKNVAVNLEDGGGGDLPGA